jgi:hypothetical protein
VSINIVKIPFDELGTGFSSKLSIDKIAPFGRNLFIDSDCLIYRDLTFIFDMFSGVNFSNIGKYINCGEWFGDVKSVCQKFRLSHLPKFNGGIYYFETNLFSSNIFRLARSLEKSYDEIGFVKLRNQPNDEVLFSLAMQLSGEKILPDNGKIIGDFQACRGIPFLDILAGYSVLINPPPPSSLNQSWYGFHKVSPAIIHFLDSFTDSYLYKREVFVLNFNHISHINYLGRLIYDLPSSFLFYFKFLFRPFFRFIFGARKIKPSQRFF